MHLEEAKAFLLPSGTDETAESHALLRTLTDSSILAPPQ